MNNIYKYRNLDLNDVDKQEVLAVIFLFLAFVNYFVPVD